jgi:hypothetical protein
MGQAVALPRSDPPLVAPAAKRCLVRAALIAAVMLALLAALPAKRVGGDVRLAGDDLDRRVRAVRRRALRGANRRQGVLLGLRGGRRRVHRRPAVTARNAAMTFEQHDLNACAEGVPWSETVHRTWAFLGGRTADLQDPNALDTRWTDGVAFTLHEQGSSLSFVLGTVYMWTQEDQQLHARAMGRGGQLHGVRHGVCPQSSHAAAG